MAQFEKDFRRLTRQINSLSNGQARASSENIFDRSSSVTKTSISSESSSDSEESTTNLGFYVEISPHDGPYAHASFVFHIEFSSESDYPDCQPTVSCLTRLYHPNIDTTYGNYHNNVCVSTLNDWDGGVNSTFEDLLQGLMFLFHSPNLEDPLTSNVTTDEDEFQKNIRISIEGGFIEDFDQDNVFEMNYGYKRYLNELQQQQQQPEPEPEPQTEEKEQLDDYLVELLTRQPNFKQIFNSDTLELLMSAPCTTPSTRHNKETTMNS
ncbi:unnamed protein product [Adineta ricciae]|uniref:UBC core domain-containing protein n=1 Tax=Adineta ricciae TaxID=249248 RepID=A0A813VK05_ADIRI|nr:unnamed protein product [Adineta ricciae]